MKTIACALLPLFVSCFVAGGALFAAEAASGSDRVTVVFAHPEKYTDVKDSSTDFENERGRENYLPLLREYLVKEANRRLPAGQMLTVTFSDIDLAGDFEPWRGFRFDDVRIVKDLYIPRFAFTFKLTDASGKVLKEGERKLADMSFQMRGNSGFPSDQLRYEKSMLSDWLRDEFSVRKR